MSPTTIPLHATTLDFESIVLSSSTPVVVDFWAPWCVWCVKLAPTYDALAAKMGGELTFVKVNVDEEPELAHRYGVSGLPTLKFYCDGREIGEIVGAPSSDRIEPTFRSILARNAKCPHAASRAEA